MFVVFQNIYKQQCGALPSDPVLLSYKIVLDHKINQILHYKNGKYDSHSEQML